MELILQKAKREMFRRRFSNRTIESYLFCITKFLKQLAKDPRKLTKKEILNYLDNLSSEGKSGSTLNLYLCSIKFLVEEVYNRKLRINLKYSRRPKRLPTFLTKEEVKTLFASIKNQKHKLMIQLLYSAGLRVSELVKLKTKDIERNNGWVRQGKGNKDRPFILSDILAKKLESHIKENNLDYNDFLFKGRNGHLSTRTIQEILKKARKVANIRKNVHPHTLRHSFATHLIEDGYTISDVQPLLGHNSLKTTMIYTHMANSKILNVKSPIETL